MISWLSEVLELALPLVSSEDDVPPRSADMNDVMDADALVSEVPELALVEEPLPACSNCMRIERLDPPTPLNDMPNSRVQERWPSR